MARTKTTYDTFSAIAEPKRRALIEAMIGQSLSVNDIVTLMDWNQPMVSKHLSVLKQVGLVSEQKNGRYRVYSVNPQELKTIDDWVTQFAQYWSYSLDNLDSYLNKIQAQPEAKDE